MISGQRLTKYDSRQIVIIYLCDNIFVIIVIISLVRSWKFRCIYNSFNCHHEKFRRLQFKMYISVIDIFISLFSISKIRRYIYFMFINDLFICLFAINWPLTKSHQDYCPIVNNMKVSDCNCYFDSIPAQHKRLGDKSWRTLCISRLCWSLL